MVRYDVFKTTQVRRAQIGMRIRLKDCTGYWLPDEVEEGQRGTVIGFKDYSIVVRSRGRQWTLPQQNVDAGMEYELPDGRWVDQSDRRAQKMRARSEAHLELVENRRGSDWRTVPF